MGEEEQESDDNHTYKSVMAELLFDIIEFHSTSKNGNSFLPDVIKAGKPSSQIIFMVAQEISSLAAPNFLPVTSSSFLVRSDDERSTFF